MEYRFAAKGDVGELARMNGELIRDEGHRNRMTGAELEERMRGWIVGGEYRAVVFEEGGHLVGYALYRREVEHVYLRQFFVERAWRRRGVGRAACEWLLANAWAGCGRIRLEVLVGNEAGRKFWAGVGFREYCVTMEREEGRAKNKD